MDPIPRPWGLDLLPLAYTDFDIQVSHLICLLWIIPPAPADCRIAVHHHLPASRVPSWAVGSETTRPYPALPEGWGAFALDIRPDESVSHVVSMD